MSFEEPEEEEFLARNVYEVLNAAADHMFTYGFVQGDYFGKPELQDLNTLSPVRNSELVAPCCARGAIIAVTRGEPDLADAAIDAINDYLGGYVDDFNDDEGRTKEQVVDALRECADAINQE